jgi:ubiquitin carboxyl-terminal hydrolase 44/49
MNNPLPSEIPVTSAGFILLGSPIGPQSFCDSIVCQRVSKIKSILDSLPDLEDSQLENTLLRSCLALPKLNFALRTCPPSLLPSSTATFDSVILDALADQVGSFPPAWSSLKASLPVALGGLGLRRATLHAPAAYIGSVAFTECLIEDQLGHPFTTHHLSVTLHSLASSIGRSDRSTI